MERCDGCPVKDKILLYTKAGKNRELALALLGVISKFMKYAKEGKDGNRSIY